MMRLADQPRGRSLACPRDVRTIELGTPGRPASVVLIHGFSVPYFIWDPTFEALHAAGMNPLRYDLYGRGYSDRPQVRVWHGSLCCIN